ncbi:MAG: glycosyltransferase family 4 protein [Minisyncoccia bacterium]
MHILFITANEKFLDEEGEEKTLLAAMVEAAEALHIVVFTKRRQNYGVKKIGEQAWVYPTNARFSFMQRFAAMRTVRRQVIWQRELRAHIVHSDDPFLAGKVGFALARRYKRVWMVNLHEPYWDFASPLEAFKARLVMLRLKTLFTFAERVCVFSERVRLYAADAVGIERAAKLFELQKVHDPQVLRNAPVRADIKKEFSAYNFVLLVAAPLGPGSHIPLALETLALLRQQYLKAGMVFVGAGRLAHLYALKAHSLDLGPWVRFVPRPAEIVSYFKTANLLLYLGSGEEEDDKLITAVATGCAIIALPSPTARMIIKDGQNGIIVEKPDAQTLVAAIRYFNEAPGLRERFKANSGAFLDLSGVGTLESLTERLKACWTYHEALPEEAQLEHVPSFGPGSASRAKWGAPVQNILNTLRLWLHKH